MTVLHPNPCYNEVCYKGTALYLSRALSYSVVCTYRQESVIVIYTLFKDYIKYHRIYTYFIIISIYTSTKINSLQKSAVV